jgi:predicted helicase
MKAKLEKIIKKDIKDGKIMQDEIKVRYYIGALKKKEREEAENVGDIFFATFAMAKEGLDIERLNTVVLATSQKDVIQSVGRVMRKILEEGDLKPLIIDFSDHLSAFINHTKHRKQFYKQSKFDVEEYNINDEIDEKLNLVEALKVDKVEINNDNDDNDENGGVNGGVNGGQNGGQNILDILDGKVKDETQKYNKNEKDIMNKFKKRFF